jgi:hypothetical protein
MSMYHFFVVRLKNQRTKTYRAASVTPMPQNYKEHFHSLCHMFEVKERQVVAWGYLRSRGEVDERLEDALTTLVASEVVEGQIFLRS